MGPGTGTPYAIRMADRKEEEAVVISVEDLARTLIDTNTFLETNTLGALDVPGIIPLLRDTRSGAELLRELGLKGGYFTKEINGRTYVILRGYAGLRKVLSASRYLPTNPKVIAYGLSRAAQAAGAAVSVVITIVVLVPMEIMRYVMDEQTLGQTFGEILSGTMVSALASAVTFGIVSLTGLTTAPAWMAVGGIIVVGMAVNVALHLLGIKPAISAFISIELDRAARHLAEEEARKARGRRILGQFDRDNPGLRYGPWRGLIGPR